MIFRLANPFGPAESIFALAGAGIARLRGRIRFLDRRHAPRRLSHA